MVTRFGTCRVCNQTFWYSAPSWGGKGRVYCDDHKRERVSAQNAERQRRFRVTHAKPKVKQFVMHIQGCHKKAYCGKAINFEAAGRWFVEHESKHWRYCKRCFELFARDMGIEVNK